MLLLILRIGFGVRAWRKGWGCRAPLPAASGSTLALLLGFAAGMAGATSTAGLAPLAFLIDAGVAAATARMAFKPPRPTLAAAPTAVGCEAAATVPAETGSLAA